MAIYDYLPTYHVVEPNNLKGLQPGFVVAQMEVARSESVKSERNQAGLLTAGLNNAKLFENGHLCSISEKGITKWKEDTVMFLHFTEPLNTVLNSDKYFAVNLEEENPRLVQLIPGDEWMTDIDYENDPCYAQIKEELKQHVKKVTKSSGMSNDDWFDVDSLADGRKAFHYIYLG